MSSSASEVVDEFRRRHHEANARDDQRAALAELLADDVKWHILGIGPVAGDYRGREAVLRYLECCRVVADVTGHADRNGAHHRDVIVSLAEWRAARSKPRGTTWHTVEVYRVASGKIAEAWLLPLDQECFDRAWEQARPAPFVYFQRVRAQDCAASGMLGHPRLLEIFEAGFIECWRNRFGQIEATLGDDRRLTVAAVNVRYSGPIRFDDKLGIAVRLDQTSDRTIRVHYGAFVGSAQVAEGISRYVCLDVASRRPAPLPDAILTSQWGNTVKTNNHALTRC